MNFFRRLTADIPGELLAAQVASEIRSAETAVAQTDVPAAASHQIVFDALGFLAKHPGAIDRDMPGFPALTAPEEDA